MTDSKTCCGPDCCANEQNATIEAVQEKYGETARSALTNDVAAVQAVAEAFGYTAAELTSIPAEANMGLSCGNPIATAHLKPGEVVVDLGSGGGLDVFLSAQKVGPMGRAIGIDMTAEMIDRSRRAAAKGVDGKPISNVEFHLASIDHLPLASDSVDVIVSNCVINLAPDKRKVFLEMFRVLRPGGRIAVSDIALKKPLPKEIAEDVMAYVGCIAGAIATEEYTAGLTAAGFHGVTVVDSKSDLNAYSKVEGQAACCSPATAASASSCCSAPVSIGLKIANDTCCEGPTEHDGKAAIHDHLAELLRQYDVNEYAASVKVFAIKPASKVGRGDE